MASSFAGPSQGGDPTEPGLCFESVGCGLDRYIDEDDAEALGCQELWRVRYAIYAVRGYCFKSARARNEFGNQFCQYTDDADVPLNDYERANIELLRSIEKHRGC